MTNKPGSLCKLERGKLIDVQEGFVDTFNWIVDVLDELTGNNFKVRELDVVKEAKYSNSTRKFTVKTEKVRAIVIGNLPKTKTVFTATPHSTGV